MLQNLYEMLSKILEGTKENLKVTCIIHPRNLCVLILLAVVIYTVIERIGCTMSY